MSNKLLTKQNYKLRDFIKISYKICPILSAIKALEGIIHALIPLLQLWATVSLIDTALSIFNEGLSGNNIYIPLLLLMIIIGYNYLHFQFMSFINLKYDIKMTKVIDREILKKRAMLEYHHIENNNTWDLIYRTCNNAVGSISMGYINMLDVVYIIIRVLSLLFVVMSQVWWAGFAIIFISVPLFFLSMKAGKDIYVANKEADKYSRYADYLHKLLVGRDNVEERTLFQYSKDVNEEWHDKYEKARKVRLKVSAKYYIKTKVSSIITILISIFIIGILLIPLSYGKLSTGMYIALVSATLDLVELMSWQLSSIMSRLANSREYLKDLTAFCGLSETAGAIDLPTNSSELEFQSIEFKNVSFKYPQTEKYVLKNFSLTIEKGIHYAIVGINGAGKTTLTKLLTGLYDNYEGEILINKRNLKEYSQADLKGLFAVIYQDFAKYSLTMKDNIALGNVLSTNNETIDKSIQLLDIENVVSSLPNGIETWLGKVKENGIDLSGGEWQRVAIARALCNPAKIRILDEPTAALDPVAESNIYNLFGKISKGKSTIFITHRLGAARLADEIIVLDQGTVKEKGSHQQLLEQGGLYSEMFEMQRSWY